MKSKPKKIIAYHFVSETLRDGSLVPENGVTLKHKGPVKLCSTGLHASKHPLDALQYAPGSVLCLVKCSKEVEQENDKFVCRERTIIVRIDATAILKEFARWCALQVIHLWKSPAVVLEWLKTGDENKRSAAWSAARSAAWSAEMAAWSAWSAVGAARSAQKKQFKKIVDKALKDAIAKEKEKTHARGRKAQTKREEGRS